MRRVLFISGASNQVINFYWELFPVLNLTAAVVNYHDSTKASEVDMYQLEERGIPYWYKDTFSDPEFIERVEGRPYIANK